MNIRNRIVTVVTIIFSLYFPAFLYGEGDIAIYNASGEITASPGKTSAGVIAVEIPDGSYIYANPKGLGIGKATEITLKENRIIRSYGVRYPEGAKYQAKGDPDFVKVYRKTVRIPFVFTPDKGADGDFIIKADLSILMCSSDTCIPFERTVEIPVKIHRGVIKSNPIMMNIMGEYLSLKQNVTGSSAKKQVEDKVVLPDTGGGIPESIAFTPHYPDGKITGLFRAVLFGLLAGFILNFMPCVLPVVSLKIMSFVMNAGKRKKVIVMQGFLFSAGIITSFLILASLAAFSGHRWGTLFQDRFFLIVMTSFIFAMALSLLGVFTLHAPAAAGRVVSKRHGIYADAFIKGGVATLLATPCSGPFLGGTLAWALTMPPEVIFTIFLSVGTGMALPYMLLALNPSLLRVVPKPGVWMNYFETAMGFVLMFTVVYLIGILDNSARMGLVLFLLFLSVGLWQFGIFGSHDKGRLERGISLIILIAVILAGYALSFNYFFNQAAVIHERENFSAERILKNRNNGIITVLEFTADWCPNCSLVEKISLHNSEVQKLFARDDVEFMVADITRENQQAESLMNRLGSRSIPFLAVFPPGEGFNSPDCLRDIYSADDVREAVAAAEKYIVKK